MDYTSIVALRYGRSARHTLPALAFVLISGIVVAATFSYGSYKHSTWLDIAMIDRLAIGLGGVLVGFTVTTSTVLLMLQRRYSFSTYGKLPLLNASLFVAALHLLFSSPSWWSLCITVSACAFILWCDARAVSSAHFKLKAEEYILHRGQLFKKGCTVPLSLTELAFLEWGTVVATEFCVEWLNPTHATPDTVAVVGCQITITTRNGWPLTPTNPTAIAHEVRELRRAVSHFYNEILDRSGIPELFKSIERRKCWSRRCTHDKGYYTIRIIATSVSVPADSL